MAVEEIPAPSASSAAETEKPLSPVTNTAGANSSGEATLNTSVLGGGAATESTCNNNNEEEVDNTPEEADGVGPEAEPEKTLELAAELAEKRAAALRENDFASAAPLKLGFGTLGSLHRSA